jgi:hypothetical protein
MIVNSKFVFVHLHKSAGTFFNGFVAQFFPTSFMVGYHFPKRMTPLAYQHLPALGFVRNPWDFYVSWYSFQIQKQKPNALFMVTSKDKTLGFADTIERLLSIHEDEELLNMVVRQLPTEFTGVGLNVPSGVLQTIGGSGLGFYSFLYDWMYKGTATAPTVIKKEAMLAGLESFFARSDIRMTDEMRAYLFEQAHQNTSSHKHYTTYYDDRIAEMVLNADNATVSAHQYNFEGA